MPASLSGDLSPFHFGGKGLPEVAAAPEDGSLADGLPKPLSKMPASLPGGLSPFQFGGKGLTMDSVAMDTSPKVAAAPEDGSSIGSELKFFTNRLRFTKTLEKGSLLPQGGCHRNEEVVIALLGQVYGSFENSTSLAAGITHLTCSLPIALLLPSTDRNSHISLFHLVGFFNGIHFSILNPNMEGHCKGI